MNVKITALPVLCADVFDGNKRIYPGGEALNFAVHASEFSGVDVTLIGAVGNDEYGKKILDAVGYRRMDITGIRIDKKLPTAYNVTYLTPEGDRYYKTDSWHGGVIDNFKLSKSDIKALSLSDVVFINYSASCFADVVELKKLHGFKLAVDFDVLRDWDRIEELAPYIDFVLISGAEEYLHIFKEMSERYDGIFNMTLGSQGSATYIHGTEYRVPAAEPDDLIDSTGCGDTYHAGFICNYMVEHNIKKAMDIASDLAAITMEHFGGF